MPGIIVASCIFGAAGETNLGENPTIQISARSLQKQYFGGAPPTLGVGVENQKCQKSYCGITKMQKVLLWHFGV